MHVGNAAISLSGNHLPSKVSTRKSGSEVALVLCDPKDSDQLLPFALLAKDLGVHYAIIKHCAVDPDGVLTTDYKGYGAIEDTLRECEALSDDTTKIVVKWNKLKHQGERQYDRCMGPPFALQMSGNGLIAPCGPLFNEKYKAFHVGNITTQRSRQRLRGMRRGSPRTRRSLWCRRRGKQRVISAT